MIESAKEDGGRVGVIAPHGVLFRGGGEGRIRKALIEENLLDAVIGLPEKLFFGTGIPAVILLFKKGRNTKDVLFIDASGEYVEGTNQNRLGEEHIKKIVATYRAFQTVPKYSYRATPEEIAENDFNLNIPRYVDTFEAEKEVDLKAVQREIETPGGPIGRGAEADGGVFEGTWPMRHPQGWKASELGEHIDLLTGFPFKSSEYSNDPEDIRLLRGDNVIQGDIRWEDARYWPRTRLADLERFFLEEGDVVLAMDRPWVKAGLKLAAVRGEDTPCLLVQRVARIRGCDELDTGYVAQVLGLQRFVEYLGSVRTETAIPHVSADQIRAFPISFPSLVEQRVVARVLGAWDRAIEPDA